MEQAKKQNPVSADQIHILPVIMAGGEGTRLRPITDTMPKPLIPVDGVPAIRRILQFLASCGFDRAVITVRYLGGMIPDLLGTESDGIALSYLKEDSDVPLGTAGSVRAAWDAFREAGDDAVLVLSGDAVFSCDMEACLSFFRRRAAGAVILTAHVPEPGAFGTVLADKEGRITGFSEKPAAREYVTDTVNTGIYLLSAEFLDRIPQSSPSDFGGDIFPAALEEDGSGGLYAWDMNGYWCDIGTPESFRGCVLAMASGGLSSVSPLFAGKREHTPPHIVRSAVGENCFIPVGASVRDSVLFDHVVLGAGASVTGAILCSHVTIGRGAVIGEGCVIGAHAVIEDGVHLAAGTSVPAFGKIGVSCDGEPKSAAEKDTGAGYLHDTGCYLSAPRMPLMPDMAFCMVLCRVLVRSAEERREDLLLSVLREDVPLRSVYAILREGLLCSAAGSGVRVFLTGEDQGRPEALPLCAVRDVPAEHGRDGRSVLHVLLTVTDGRLSALLAGADGFYFSREEERAFDRCLADVLTGGDGSSGALPAETALPAEPVFLDRQEIINGYAARHSVHLGKPDLHHRPKPFLFRTGNLPGEALLARMLTRAGGIHSMDAPVFFHLFPASSLDDSEGLLSAADLDVPERLYSHWELFALWAVLSGRHETLSLPFGIPAFVTELLQVHGIPFAFYTLCPAPSDRSSPRARTQALPEARDGVLLGCRIAALLSEKECSLSALYAMVFGEHAPEHIRIRQKIAVGSGTASALRRLTEEEDRFCADREGVVLHGSPASGTTVRVTASRAPGFRVIADAFSAEEGEALCEMAKDLLKI
ncbi:MAG: NDP-sugar synthase [Clostridia bacterium]|nr:NDP-sugar synthase [Clostridia bacterium]